MTKSVFKNQQRSITVVLVGILIMTCKDRGCVAAPNAESAFVEEFVLHHAITIVRRKIIQMMYANSILSNFTDPARP